MHEIWKLRHTSVIYENVHVEVMCIYAFYKFWLFTH